MTPATSPLSQRLGLVLRQREAALSTALDNATSTAVARADGAADVEDFKDLASSESEAEVADVVLDHSAAELAQVRAALRRLEEGRYGLCTACGGAIGEQRLLAMPAAALCTACQTAAEREAQGR